MMSLRDQLKKLNVGMSRKTVSLAPHNANWTTAFRLASDSIKRHVPKDLDLHHIGSTSIPNIHAKPIIDILGIVPSIEIFDSRRSELEALGFVWKGEYGIANRRYCVLYDESEEIGLIHLHVFAKADHEVERHLVFRDYLRASPEASRRYEELKRKLADAHADTRTEYSEGKSVLIAQLLSEAFEWKKLKIARHETGHAAMALRYGRRIQVVSLREKDSPRGTDRYRGFTELEPEDPNVRFTGEKAIQKIMISLGGYASEILFYDGLANIGGDDLTIAVKTAEDMLKDEQFRNWVDGLPVPEPSALDMIENLLVRKYLHFKIGDCTKALASVGQVIQKVADELYKREELSGDEFSTLFDSIMQSNMGGDQMKHPSPIL